MTPTEILAKQQYGRSQLHQNQETDWEDAPSAVKSLWMKKAKVDIITLLEHNFVIVHQSSLKDALEHATADQLCKAFVAKKIKEY